MSGSIDIQDGFAVAGFDPPAMRNLGYAVLVVKNGVAGLASAGVHPLPDGESNRILSIQSFVVDLFDDWNIGAFCFERSIGRGFEKTRELIGENTGVIKLVGASYGSQLVGFHPSTTAKVWTGYGGHKDEKGHKIKTRVKRMSRDVFYPGQTYTSIANDESGRENFEHQADALGLAATWLLKHGVPVSGPGMSVLPLIGEKVDEE